MFKIKILCLGNEFIVKDNLAKKIAYKISNELSKDKFEFINIKDSFQLLDYLTIFDKKNIQNKNQEKIFILDVVQNILEVKIISIEDLSVESITNAHDFDAGFFLKLLNPKNIKIIGIPMNISKNKVNEIKESVKKILKE